MSLNSSLLIESILEDSDESLKSGLKSFISLPINLGGGSSTAYFKVPENKFQIDSNPSTPPLTIN